jgi:SAM-dependent methyltransferase
VTSDSYGPMYDLKPPLSSSRGVDPFDAWREAQLRCPARRARLDRDTDLEFWSRMAPQYDESSSLARQAPQVVKRVLEIVDWPATLLDIGAGTGGFSLPLAWQAGRVTALDHSPDMLAVLERRLSVDGPGNVLTLQADAESANLGRHEVVFSANAMYRTLDLRRWLERANAAAERLVLLVLSVGRQPAAPAPLLDLIGRDRLPDGAGVQELLAGLDALGITPAVESIEVERSYSYVSAEAALRVLTRSIDLSVDERARCLGLLESKLSFTRSAEASLEYHHSHQVALISWEPSA